MLESQNLLENLRQVTRQLSEERRIFFGGPVVVFKWRNAAGWPVEYASANVEQVFGYTAQEFLEGAVAYADVIDAKDLERVTREVREASEGGRTSFIHEPYRIYRKNGEPAWLDDYTTILRDEDGAVVHYVGYVIDTTERRSFEEESAKLRAQLLHAQKLESLGVLAGGIAHDFNNLLTGILGNVDLALEAGSPEAAARHLELIRISATRAADLCQQMLAYSGRGQFIVGSYDLNGLIAEMAELLAVSISKPIELRCELAEGLPPIKVDATQIRQLLLNLITNASEAIGDDGGVIVLETGVRGERVFARISDTGCGMDAQTRERIFDPFFTTKAEGRGLGLAAVLGILRGHGGAIQVESQPGQGTTIECLLPIASRPPEAVPVRPRFSPSWRGRGTALVIDDEEMVRILASHVLGGVGFKVVAARDGAEGLALFREQEAEIAVVFLDLTMPRMGGVQVHRELRRIRPDLPILLSSGFEKEEATAHFDMHPLPAFLKKPFQPRELLIAVRHVIESHLPLGPHGEIRAEALGRPSR